MQEEILLRVLGEVVTGEMIEQRQQHELRRWQQHAVQLAGRQQADQKYQQCSRKDAFDPPGIKSRKGKVTRLDRRGDDARDQVGRNDEKHVNTCKPTG
ncbi:hypothetical protein D3C81_670660 [compost metagenome]